MVYKYAVSQMYSFTSDIIFWIFDVFYTGLILNQYNQFPDFFTPPVGGFINNILRGLLGINYELYCTYYAALHILLIFQIGQPSCKLINTNEFSFYDDPLNFLWNMTILHLFIMQFVYPTELRSLSQVPLINIHIARQWTIPVNPNSYSLICHRLL